MKIRVPIECEYSFVLLLKRKIEKDLTRYMKTQSYFDKYVKDIFKVDISVEKITKEWIKSIVILKTQDDWIITTDTTRIYPKTKITVHSIMMFIANGNTQIRGISFIQSYFTQLKRNIYRYYIVWKRIGVLV